MVPHEAFACRRAKGDVVLRQSYKPESCDKLYYACPKSKMNNHMFFICVIYKYSDTRLRELMSSPGAPSTPSYSAGPSTLSSYSSGPSMPPSYSSGLSTPTNYSVGSSRNAECSNSKHLRGKISVLKETMDMHMHPEQHTVNSAALLHEVLNEMEKLDLELFLMCNVIRMIWEDFLQKSTWITEIDLDSIRCPVCDNDLETEKHILVKCDIAKSVWNDVLKSLLIISTLLSEAQGTTNRKLITTTTSSTVTSKIIHNNDARKYNLQLEIKSTRANMAIRSPPQRTKVSPPGYPDVIDLAGMDYSPPRRKTPIHN
uniref:RNA-directed DNA polymerase, eukaryota, reverse transcriptase zinc-binding domain protein n=1 Tax=Tanacetum cinerariifolium TaxID=118510 RepID=A0A6L2KXH3_TANCI|nr:RNA-directed DNA polymerase, eukaryota, reverse transcriptase zinc-binding domain protein [Tanacetum cinerariifolium]